MRKTAEAKFNEYLADCRATTEAVNALTDRSYEFYDGYAYAAGFLGSMLREAIAELPRARREAMREQLNRKAQEFVTRKEMTNA